MTFQDIIQALNVFWAKQGCIIGQPYGVEVGAGTGNPNTFFRVLGPEPFNIAYVEPSRRPTDGRYGKSPNRFQHYYQYQVLLKPAPKFNQELFIESLIAIGLDPEKHDIRFVEDNWESTPLGAWGLGWEVWCDGMEVAQYTYFQQMAGTPLEVPALEITYGLERLAMYIQNVDHYKDLQWNETTTYADLFERHEFWQATHNFETSTPESLQLLYATYEKEVAAQLAQKNYWGAYDYLLKVSHTFNLLDARGMVSVSDRVAKFGIMGRFTKEISAQYLEERKNLGYPLKNRVGVIGYKPPVASIPAVAGLKHRYQKNVAIVELGFEEIPVDYLQEWGSVANHAWLKSKLREQSITFRKAYLYITPRRIVIKIVQPSKQGRVEQVIKGPATAVAFSPDGKPTDILIGYLKKNDAKIRDISKEVVNGKEIVVLRKVLTLTLATVLQHIIDEIIALAPKTKWMVWEQNLPAFIRPLRWMIAYHNKQKLPLSLMGIANGQTTPLPRYEKPAVAKISSAQEYLQFIRSYGIILSQKKRAARIARESYEAGDTKIGKFTTMVEKNTYLTENPHVAAVKLEKRYAELPRELVTLILEKNQMYPLTTDKSENIWYHVVANHRRVHKRIAEGNQKVAKARLEDGVFYFQQDAAKKLEAFESGLQYIGFHPKAGSYLEKKKRIATWTEKVYGQLQKKVPTVVTEALTLLKNDKATSLGKEFPSLEGIIGRVYALRDGVSPDVAALLADHYLPYEPDGKLPPTEEATILSIADKLDTLQTLASVEKLPEGSHDPFEIRKTVYRLLALLTKGKVSLQLDNLPENLITFIKKRFQQQLEDEQVPYWIANAVAWSASTNFALKYTYAQELQKVTRKKEEEILILDTFKRIANILKKNPITKTIGLSKKLLATMTEPEEKSLLEFVLTHQTSIGTALEPTEIPKLAHVLEQFFAKIMVIDKVESIKIRRLSILQKLYEEIETNFHIDFT